MIGLSCGAEQVDFPQSKFIMGIVHIWMESIHLSGSIVCACTLYIAQHKQT